MVFGISVMVRGWRLGVVLAFALGVVGSAPLLFAYLADYDIHAIYHSFVSVWINSAVVGYIVGLPVFERLAADVERLAPLLDPAQRARARATLSDIWSNPAVWGARAVGVLYGFIPSAPTLLHIIQGQPGAFIYLWVPLLIPLLWAVALPALWRLIRLSLFVYRLGSELRVDLGDQRLLGVFTDIGIRHLLIIVVGLSVIPMQAILTGAIHLNDFAPALIATAPVALIVLVLPILGVHRGVVAAKGLELDRMTSLFEAADRDSERFLLLSLYRQRVAETSEWPLSAGSASRVVLYVVIPPLAWIAAALVENLVSNLLR
jgi:hypothetical protein